MAGTIKTSFKYASNELEALAEAKNYYQWIVAHFARYIGKRVVEVGAGIGNFSDFLLQSNALSQLILVEPAENLVPQLQERFSKDDRVEVIHGYLESLDESLLVDSVILVNVLEHVEDDLGALRRIREILPPEGRLLLFVPALPFLFNSLDDSFEHVRRYTKPLLGARLRETGYRIEVLRYLNLPGVCSWFLTGKILRAKTLRPWPVRIYDRWFIPWVSRLERYWEPPVGSSLIAVVKK